MSPELVIFDRDNTLVRVPEGARYLYGTDPIELLPGVAPALRHLAKRGITCVVATNQQGISLPEFPLMTMESVGLFNLRLSQKANELGGEIDRFYICPHLETEGCDCRKPRPGLFLRALQDYKKTPDQVVGIGNSQLDVDAAVAAGVRAIAVPCPPDTRLAIGVPVYPTILHAVRSMLAGEV